MSKRAVGICSKAIVSPCPDSSISPPHVVITLDEPPLESFEGVIFYTHPPLAKTLPGLESAVY
jgi:hypothetical protein